MKNFKSRGRMMLLINDVKKKGKFFIKTNTHKVLMNKKIRPRPRCNNKSIEHE